MTSAPNGAEALSSFTVDDLAQEIRRVDGNHALGAGALAEALMPLPAPPPSVDGLDAGEKDGLPRRVAGAAEENAGNSDIARMRSEIGTLRFQARERERRLASVERERGLAVEEAAVWRRSSEDNMRRVAHLEATLRLPDADRRQWFIGDFVARVGHINRSDIRIAFGVSKPQASADLKRWIAVNPGKVDYDKMAKRYQSLRATVEGAADV